MIQMLMLVIVLPKEDWIERYESICHHNSNNEVLLLRQSIAHFHNLKIVELKCVFFIILRHAAYQTDYLRTFIATDQTPYPVLSMLTH